MSSTEPTRLPLKRPAKYGVYMRWPIDGDDWIHPEDVEAVKKVIPSRRVFRREDIDLEYSLISYADLRLRVRPTMWLEIEDDGYWVGDQVEVKSEMGQRHAMIATIREILWDPDAGRIEYHLQSADREPPHRTFSAEEFQIARRLGEPLTWRERKLLSRSRLK